MSQALLHCKKAHQTDDGWLHPATGEKLNDDGPEVFCFWIENVEGRPIMSCTMARTILEQVRDGIDKALTIDPVVIRRCQ